MNIITARATWNKARTAAKAGDHLEAARLFFWAQREARQCRAAARREIFDYAHAGACMQAAKILETSTDHAQRSEAGRIKAESTHLYNKGL